MTDLPEHITRCHRYLGFHAYNAGPCFDTMDEAVRYRDMLDHFGVTWKPQDQSWWSLSMETGRAMPEGKSYD